MCESPRAEEVHHPGGKHERPDDFSSGRSNHCDTSGSTGAGDGTRTHDVQLGKLAFYQLNYARTSGRYPPTFLPATTASGLTPERIGTSYEHLIQSAHFRSEHRFVRRIADIQLTSHLAVAAAAALWIACGGGGAPTIPIETRSCVGGHDTTKVPLNDLGAGCYLSFQGGIYAGGTNALAAQHLAAGLAAASRIRPRDVNGNASPNGKYVLLSVGMSNTTQEFCSDGGLPGSCHSTSFVAQAMADAAVNHSTLVLVNGAYGGRTASAWTSAAAPDYDRIRDTWLTPLGLSERQVQIAWVKVANAQPRVSLPDTSADAYVLTRQLGQIARALRARYPNLQQIFLTSRIYAGYATSALNPEPYAYESALGVKWAIEAQIREMSGAPADPRAGSLRYDDGTAPWLAWGPYPWAAGTHARSDGLTWVVSDFNPSDRTHPASSARQKVGAMLLAFLKTSPVTQCWFLAGRTCR